MSRVVRRTLTLALLGWAAACGSDSGGTEPQPTPKIAVSVTPTTLTVQQGGSGAATVSVTGSGGFSGSATVTVQGVPAGVSAAVTGVGTTGGVTTGTVTVGVAASVAPASYPIVVRASGGGVAPVEANVTLVVTAAPSFTLTAAPTALSVVRGGAGSSVLTLARSNFTGPVAFSAVGTPSDVTVSFDPQPATGASTTATVTVGATAPLGVHTLTLRGVSPVAGERTTTVQLTVTAPAAGDFALQLTPAGPIQLARGANGQTVVVITRSGGFTGAVDLSVTGAPAGLSATLSASSTTGAAVTLSLGASPTATPGSYTLTVAGTAGPGTRTVDLTVEILAPSGGPVVLDFSTCDPLVRPIWLAWQDGLGSQWIPVTGTAERYELTPSQNKVGVAWVWRFFAGSENTEVRFLSRDELDQLAAGLPCDESGRTVSGTVVNTDTDLIGGAFLGGAVGPLLPTGGTDANFTIRSIPDGTHDFVAWLGKVGGLSGAERIVIRRDLDPADGAVLTPIDATGAEPQAPATADFTLANLDVGETVRQSTSFHTGTSCVPAGLYNVSGGSTFTAYGAPNALLRPTDTHAVTAFATAGSTTARTVTRFLKTLGPRTLTLPPHLPVPTVTEAGGPYRRLGFAFVQPGNYDGTTSIRYNSITKTMLMHISVLGYVGSSSINFTFPDLGAGYDPAWAPGAQDNLSWVVSASGSNNLAPCVEGAEVWTAERRGS